MILFYSGSCGKLKGGSMEGEPETALGKRANVMLSYWLISNRQQDQHSRFPRIVKNRRRRRGCFS